MSADRLAIAAIVTAAGLFAFVTDEDRAAMLEALSAWAGVLLIAASVLMVVGIAGEDQSRGRK